MEDLVVPNSIEINSYKGQYSLKIINDFREIGSSIMNSENHFIIDKKVESLYREELAFVNEGKSKYLVEATEENKSIERIIPIFNHLVVSGIKRNHKIVAIGGGITQDISCFISSTILRGIDWVFMPTTLLAQADSCIGSKSSINLGETKNILGTFEPPKRIILSTHFLKTLESKDIQSGIGEMIKVHAIDGPSSYNSISKDYNKLLDDDVLLERYIYDSLLIKKRYIEEDEFDKGIRNIFNYGHSFGHAIESATNFSIPHGIAITIGMDMANYIASERNLISSDDYRRMNKLLSKNYQMFQSTKIEFEPFYQALLKDKKNTSTHLALIFPSGKDVEIKKHLIDPDEEFRDQCKQFFMGYRI